MIIPLAGILIGALLGILRAKRLNGKPLDLAQWGGVMAIIGGVVGLFVLVLIERAAV